MVVSDVCTIEVYSALGLMSGSTVKSSRKIKSRALSVMKVSDGSE